MQTNIDPDIVFNWTPICSASFPFCGLLLRLIPPPETVSQTTAAAIACTLCLAVVGLIPLLCRIFFQLLSSISDKDNKAALIALGSFFSFFAVLFGFGFLFKTMSKNIFIFSSVGEYVGFFVVISALFSFVKSLKHALANAQIP